MNAPDDNNANPMTPESPEPGIKTLGDLRTWIAGLPQLSEAEKAQLRSAVKRADELIGHGALDLAADPRRVLSRLEQLSPTMAGMNRQAFSNLKSRVRRAFQLATPVLKPARSFVRLTGEWQSLAARLDVKAQRTLSRFFRFACGQSWQPQEISDAQVEIFKTYLRDEAVVVSWDRVVSNTVKAWNRLREGLDGTPLQRLTAAPLTRTPYWIAEDQLPPGLRHDLDAYITGLSTPNIFGEGAAKTLKPGTIEQHRYAVIALTSALLASGERPDVVSSLAYVVRPSTLKRALRFLYDRAGQRVTWLIFLLALRARMIARWCKLTAPELEEIDKIVESLDDQRPSTRGMAEKNRRVVRHLEDPGFRDRLLLLPERLLSKAYAMRNGRLAATYARAALVIELLLTCSMRRQNLLSLRLDENIRRIGSGAACRWLIELPSEDVKNEEPLRFELLPETVHILEKYLADWRRKLCSKPTPWLFPNSEGGPLDGDVLLVDIAQKTKRELGVRIGLHQFRHLSTELYLQENPEGLAVASLHLGHRDQNTTRRFYARRKQREATRRYQQHLIDKREGAKRRQVRRRPRLCSGPARNVERDVR
jgi:integrase